MVFSARRRLRHISLQEIGEKHGTDKAAQTHAFDGRTFLEVYEQYVSQFREQHINVLEIGVLGGASLRTWRDYGRLWRIFGIDINPTALTASGERIEIDIGSQDDPDFLRSCFGASTKFDIIVDDGSHINSFTLTSLRALFTHRLNAGGIYIIEDLASSYGPMYEALKVWPGMHLNDPSKDYSNDRRILSDAFDAMIHEMDFLQGPVEYVHFWSRFAVIGKRRTIPQTPTETSWDATRFGILA
jgi:hypothetical protein